MIRDLGDVDQAVNAGDDLGKSTEGHQFDDLDGGHVAHGILLGEYGPRLLRVILHAQRDLLLLGVEGDDVHIHGVAHGDDLGGVLDAGPGQLGDVDHAVHAADVNESAVRGQALDGAGVVLAYLDVVPHLSGGGGTGLGGHGTDGADHAAAGTVDLSDAQLHALLDHLGQVGAAGLAGLGSGDEHPDALDVGHQATLVLLGDDTLEHVLVLNGVLDGLPVLLGVQTLLGQLDHAVAVADQHDVGLDLLADLADVLDLDIGIVAQLRKGDVAGILDTQFDLHFSRRDRDDGASDLIPRIQSLERLLQHLCKGLFNLHNFFAHFVIDLLYDPPRRRCAGGDSKGR